MDKVDQFRESFRSDLHPRYNGRLHFLFTATLSIALITAFGFSLHQVTALEWLTVPLTFLYANLAEYLGHRGPMHHLRRGLKLVYRRHAGQHHRFFTHKRMSMHGPGDYYAVLFPPTLVTFFLIAFTLPAYFLLRWLATDNVAALFVMTGVAYFLNYELLHFAYHQPADSWIGRLPGVQRLRRLHRHHHRPERMAHCNFNVTYPISDWLFGTFERESPEPKGKDRISEETV